MNIFVALFSCCPAMMGDREDVKMDHAIVRNLSHYNHPILAKLEVGQAEAGASSQREVELSPQQQEKPANDGLCCKSCDTKGR